MKYKYTAIAKKWNDKINGNTYHSVRIIDNATGNIIYCPMEYGYGEQYKHTALSAMFDHSWLPSDCDTYNYERLHNYPILWVVSEGLKRECIANGTPIS